MKFKVGDKVRRINDVWNNLSVGTVGTVVDINEETLRLEEYPSVGWLNNDRFELEGINKKARNEIITRLIDLINEKETNEITHINIDYKDISTDEKFAICWNKNDE